MDKLTFILVTIIGILLVLPLIGVSALAGALTDWVIAIAVLIIGVKGLIKK
tara:strand:- start:2194 stop:2346 length:153 start_codon:yes stop_codon:yes gene_type:complete